MKDLLLIYTVDTLSDQGAFWEIKLKSKKLSTEPYSRIVLHISKDYLLKKQLFYYGNKLDFSKDYRKSDLSQPRLEVNYDSYTKKGANADIFKSSTYATITKTGKIILSGKFKSYELIDRRELSNKINNKN